MCFWFGTGFLIFLITEFGENYYKTGGKNNMCLELKLNQVKIIAQTYDNSIVPPI